jgi:microcystin-dependent protein
MSSDDFVGAVKLFAGNFAFVGSAMCQGQLMAISQNTALFSLLGTSFGGDGRSTFGLPDLRGRVPIGVGQGAGLTNRVLGEIGGSENVTLTTTTVPTHSHTLNATTALTSTTTAGPSVLTGTLNASDGKFYTTPNQLEFVTVAMNPGAVSARGGSLPHNNIQPSMGINYLIMLQGVFPSRA